MSWIGRTPGEKQALATDLSLVCLRWRSLRVALVRSDLLDFVSRGSEEGATLRRMMIRRHMARRRDALRLLKAFPAPASGYIYAASKTLKTSPTTSLIVPWAELTESSFRRRLQELIPRLVHEPLDLVVHAVRTDEGTLLQKQFWYVSKMKTSTIKSRRSAETCCVTNAKEVGEGVDRCCMCFDVGRQQLHQKKTVDMIPASPSTKHRTA